MILAAWSFTAPTGVSLVEHCRQLPAFMRAVHHEAGNKDAVFVVSPEVAAIFDVVGLRPWFKDWPLAPGQTVAQVGTLFEIPVWVNLYNMGNEVLVAEDPDEPYALAKLVIDNLIDTTILDRLAQV